MFVFHYVNLRKNILKPGEYVILKTLIRAPASKQLFRLFLLLLAPDIHYRLMRQMLYSEDLRADGEAAD